MTEVAASTQTATAEITRGFVLRKTGAMRWKEGKLFLPEFLEILYQNGFNAEGWHWSATIRGRRINAADKLGAADAEVWFSSNDPTTPDWVTTAALEHMPTTADEADIVGWADSREPLTTGTRGMWRGRHPVTVHDVSPITGEIGLKAVHPGETRLVESRHWSALEFIPDTASAGMEQDEDK